MSRDSPIARARQRGDLDLVAYLRLVLGDPCCYCGAPSAVLDHVTPKVRDGSDQWSNLTASCSRCNLQKRALSLLGFLGWRNHEREREQALALEAEAKRLRGFGAAYIAVGV